LPPPMKVYSSNLAEKPYEKGVIRAFAELAEEGGYVWAQSYVSKTAKVGYVKGWREGGEGVVIDRDARWEMRGNSYPGRQDGHPAALMTLLVSVGTRNRGGNLDEAEAISESDSVGMRPPLGVEQVFSEVRTFTECGKLCPMGALLESHRAKSQAWQPGGQALKS
jgi:hypothetical protein